MDFSDGCPVCLEDYSHKNSPQRLPCGHTICIKCLSKILKEIQECPYCRHSFRPDEIYPNISFLSKIIEQNIENLSELKKVFKQRLNEVVHCEIIKQEQALTKINDMKSAILKEVNIITEKISNIISDAIMKQEIIIDEIDSEIELLKERLEFITVGLNIDEISFSI